jgi:hypothetical protein
MFDLEVNAEETKNMFVSRHKKGGQNHNIANRVFENEARLKYLEVTVTKQNLIHRKLI